jgi:hypothetical protein
MNLTTVLPFITVIIMVLLTVDVFRRYQAHHGSHFYLLIWGIGLGMFALASLSEALLSLAWNPLAFRAWFLFGAILSAAWIGQGTVLLLVRKNWARILLGILIVASLAAAAVMLTTVITNEQAFVASKPVAEQYRDMLSNGVRALAAPFNIYGTIALVGGALWSAYLFWRKEILPNRVIGNVLIAAGALAIASASSLALLGNGEFLAPGELVFALLIYLGFVLASKPAAEEVRGAGAAQPA